MQVVGSRKTYRRVHGEHVRDAMVWKAPKPGVMHSWLGAGLPREARAQSRAKAGRADYKKFRASAAADDTTPEVFLLSGLLDLGDYDRCKKVLEELKAKQAAQPAYAPVIEHFSRLVAEAAAAKKP